MEQWELNQNSLPNDIALNIASSLQVSDVCALGSCSRFWRELCASDCIWVSLSRDRWPSLDLSKQSSLLMLIEKGDSSDEDIDHQFSFAKGWRSFYIKRHNEMADRVTAVVKFVEQCAPSESLEVRDYLKAIENLCSMELEFKDVVMFLFSSKKTVLLNLVGLHYSIFWLGVPVDYVIKALRSCHVSERLVCVRWWKLGRWFHGFRLPDESHSRRISLGDIALAKEEVLGVLHRGAIYEVLRVQISVANPIRIPWAYQKWE